MNIPFVTPNRKLLRIHYALQFCELRNLPFVLIIKLDPIQTGRGGGNISLLQGS